MWYGICCCCSNYLKILLHFLSFTLFLTEDLLTSVSLFLSLWHTFFSLTYVFIIGVSNLIMMNFDIVLFITWDFCVSLELLYSFHEFWKYSAITSSNVFCSLPLQELFVTPDVLQHTDAFPPPFSLVFHSCSFIIMVLLSLAFSSSLSNLPLIPFSIL